MRTVREMARVLGWPEARRASARKPTVVTYWGYNQNAPGKPRLHIRKDRSDGGWRWEIWEGCLWHGGGRCCSWAVALTVGLANLDTVLARHPVA